MKLRLIFKNWNWKANGTFHLRRKSSDSHSECQRIPRTDFTRV